MLLNLIIVKESNIYYIPYYCRQDFAKNMVCGFKTFHKALGGGGGGQPY